MIEDRNHLTRRAFLRDSVGAIAGATLLSPTIVPVLGLRGQCSEQSGRGRHDRHGPPGIYFNLPSFLGFARHAGGGRVRRGRLAAGERSQGRRGALRQGQPSGAYKGCAAYRLPRGAGPHRTSTR